MNRPSPAFLRQHGVSPLDQLAVDALVARLSPITEDAVMRRADSLMDVGGDLYPFTPERVAEALREHTAEYWPDLLAKQLGDYDVRETGMTVQASVFTYWRPVAEQKAREQLEAEQ